MFTDKRTGITIYADLNVTVIHATHRNEDLIPTFMAVIKDTPEYDKFIEEIPDPVLNGYESDWFDTDDATWMLAELFDVLDKYAPEGYYFGSHPGDGSDFAYWEVVEGL